MHDLFILTCTNSLASFASLQAFHIFFASHPLLGSNPKTTKEGALASSAA
jgi:hypothetical protein